MSPQTWQALSALCDEAAEHAPAERRAWLDRRRVQGDPLATRLEQLLDALDEVETGDFLQALPVMAVAGHAPGSRVGPFRLERRLGEGGMAEVWLARADDGRLKRPVALKLLHRWRRGAAFAPRFERERDILATLDHPRIAGLLDAGVDARDGQPWLALEFVDGEPITAHADRLRLDLRSRIALFRQVLLAVQHAHGRLVLHRDLKPGNILVTPEGWVKLLDFGIAKLLAEPDAASAETELTRAAGRPLTPRYASPEQVLGRPLTTASDVYALGVVLYELLCGRRPHDEVEARAGALERAICDVDPKAPSQHVDAPAAQARRSEPRALRRALAGELDGLVLKALARTPEQRYTSVDALLADVDRWLAGEAVLARPPGWGLKLHKFVRRHPLGVGLGSAAIVALLALTTATELQRQRAQAESARAVAARDFLLDLFRRADPDAEGGKDITARQLLKGARERVAARLGGQAALQADLLRGLGDLHVFMGEYAEADRIWADVVDALRPLGDRDATALALVERADTAWRMGELERARELLADAARTAPGRRRPELRARLAMTEGIVAQLGGRIEDAESTYQTAGREIAAAFGPDSSEAVELLRWRASLASLRHDSIRARALLGEAIALAHRDPGTLPRSRHGMEAELALIEYGAGAYERAWSLTRPATLACDADLGPASENCLLLKQTAVSTALKRGDVAGAQRFLPSLISSLEAAQSSRRAAEISVVVARALAASDRLHEHPGVADRVRRIAWADEGRQLLPAQRRIAQLVDVEVALRQGRTAEAGQGIDRLLAEERRVPLEGAIWKSRQLLLSGVHARQEGRHEASLGLLREAQAQAAAESGADHPIVCLYALNQWAPLASLGRFVEASEVARGCLPALRDAAGRDAPLVARIGEIEQRLALGEGRQTGPASTEFFF